MDRVSRVQAAAVGWLAAVEVAVALAVPTKRAFSPTTWPCPPPRPTPPTTPRATPLELVLALAVLIEETRATRVTGAITGVTVRVTVGVTVGVTVQASADLPPLPARWLPLPTLRPSGLARRRARAARRTRVHTGPGR